MEAILHPPVGPGDVGESLCGQWGAEVRGAQVWARRRYFLAPARFGSILLGYGPSRASFQSEPSRA